jgi:hypothetical protein
MNFKSIKKFLLPASALSVAAALIIPAETAIGYSLLGGSLGYTQRDVRVFNNFPDNASNNNNVADANFPGYQGCFIAFWKGAIEWASELQGGNGNGDPGQNGGLGSGAANFDPFFAGETSNTGGTNDNIVSSISSCSSGVLAYCETPISNGWRIRMCESWTWADGPTTNTGGGMDIQGVFCHEYGHALGLGHSTAGSATMYPSASGNGIPARSIASDDIAGVQAIYGPRASNKPTISSLGIGATSMTITGTNFTPTGNQVWFTPSAVSSTGGDPKVIVNNLTSNGTSITVNIPAAAGPGNVMVKTSGNGHDDMSNAWPSDLADNGGGGGGGCDSPTNYCTTTGNSYSPFGAVMSFNGTASYSANDLVLECYGAIPNQFGIFYYGPNQISAPFGNGLRCVGAGFLGTFRLPVVQADSFGDVSYALDYNQAPMNAGNGTVVDGLEFNFQFWYRDPGTGANFNLSDGLKVTFCP